MLLFILPLVAGLTGLFAGSQIDDAVEKKFEPVGGGVQKQGLPTVVKIPLMIAGGTAAFFITKRLVKKAIK